MKLPLGPRDAERLAKMSPVELHAFLIKCGPAGVLALDAAFEMWAANGQIAPASEGWRVWLMMAGRGFGKTRAGAEWVHDLAMGGRKQIALVAASIDEGRKVMVEGLSGLLTVARKRRVPINWEAGLGRIKWPKGSVATIYSGDHADGLRGPEHHFAWWRCSGSTCCCARRSKGRHSPHHPQALHPVLATWSPEARPGRGQGMTDRSRPSLMAAGGSLRRSKGRRFWTAPVGRWLSGATAVGKAGSSGLRNCASTDRL